MFMLNLVFIFFFHYNNNNYKDAKHKFRGPGARMFRRGPTGSRVGIASDGPGGGTPRCL